MASEFILHLEELVELAATDRSHPEHAVTICNCDFGVSLSAGTRVHA
jgi:hypothetical protein